MQAAAALMGDHGICRDSALPIIHVLRVRGDGHLAHL